MYANNSIIRMCVFVFLIAIKIRSNFKGADLFKDVARLFEMRTKIKVH